MDSVHPASENASRTLPKCAECRVGMKSADFDKSEAHAVNCKLFRKSKRAWYFMPYGQEARMGRKALH